MRGVSPHEDSQQVGKGKVGDAVEEESGRVFGKVRRRWFDEKGGETSEKK